MLFRIDDHLFHVMFGRGHSELTMAAVIFSALGGGWSLVAFTPLAFSRRTRRLAQWMFLVLGGTGIVVFALKEIVGRGRPFTVYAGLEKALLDSPTDHSFPSGHAAGSFAFALFVAHALLDRSPKERPPLARTAAAACVVFASCVGVSRVVLGFHFPLDVLAGAILGGTIGGVAGRRFTARRRL